MGQDEVLEILKKNKGWMITGEIADMVDISRAGVSKSLRLLFKEGVVMRKEVKTRRVLVIYGSTRIKKMSGLAEASI